VFWSVNCGQKGCMFISEPMGLQASATILVDLPLTLHLRELQHSVPPLY
jgi:hypothetical protein